MAEPIREQVLAKIAEKLRGMTGLRSWGGTYQNDPTVERRFRTPAEVAQFPFLVVEAASGSEIGYSATGGAAAVNYLQRFRVVVYGYIQGDDAVLPSTWRNRLFDDVLLTMAKNETLDGLVRNVSPEGEEETDEGELYPLGAFSKVFTVEFSQQVATA